MINRIGRRTIEFDSAAILGYASVAGEMEGRGPLGDGFDRIITDSYAGEETFEDAESGLQFGAMTLALSKCGLEAGDIDAIFAGDLLNQCVGSSFAAKLLDIPFLGQYAACSTMAQSLLSAAVFASSGAVRRAMCVTSSHFCSAERQYRFPLEYGSVRTPTAQWTVTGAGCCIVGSDESAKVRIRRATTGIITDYGITDANNMGAAMAPAAADTMLAYFADTKTVPQDYDAVFTGDLGEVGCKVLCELLSKEGIELNGIHNDCGLMIYDRNSVDVHAGGSGAGCCASVLCSKILGDLSAGRLRNVLFTATGALLSATTAGQGKTIPGIAHLINLTAD